jgi:hypothetical protein
MCRVPSDLRVDDELIAFSPAALCCTSYSGTLPATMSYAISTASKSGKMICNLSREDLPLWRRRYRLPLASL